MKGESREAKGHETTGGGRTWYGKRKTLTPLLKREDFSERLYQRCFYSKGANI